MHADRSIRGRIAALLVATFLGACGGGEDAAAPATQTLGPGASTVSSSDGKVTLTVGDNALQASTAIRIAPATPDAATAADPSLVPGTTYDYTSPGLQVPEQVVIRIESPHAVAEAAPERAQANGVRRSLALPSGYWPPPTCLVNSPVQLAPVQNVWVSGAQCPQSPAPACIKVAEVPPGPPMLVDGQFVTSGTKSLCAPAAELVAIPNDAICPAGFREITGEGAGAAFAAQHAFAKLCQKLPTSSPPVLGFNGHPSSIPCSPRNGHFLCVADSLPNGRLSVLWDRTPPPTPGTSLDAPLVLGAVPSPSGVLALVGVPENGTPTPLAFQLIASDPVALGGVELVEVLGPNQLPSPYGSGVAIQPAVQRWSAPAGTFAGAPKTSYTSPTITVPHALADPAVRIFFVRAFDRSGNSASSSLIGVKGIPDAITIEQFVIGKAAIFNVLVDVVAFKIKGAAAASVDQGVGSLTVTDDLLAASDGFVQLVPVPGRTYTLTATHPTRATKTAAFTFGTDVTAPAVQLVATPTGLVAPGSTTLSATASDAVGVAKVEFYRGTTLIATDTTAPYAHTVALLPADAGTLVFTAKAYDAANNVATSNAVSVAVGLADTTPPTVSLAATPATLVAPGVVTLQATAADAGGIARVEFHRGSTLLATATSPPYQTAVALTAADAGSVAFTARAIDTQQNSTVSAPAVVVVTAASAQDVYASPTGVDLNNPTCTQANPCRSIAQAAAAAPPGGTVWLTNGAYTGATQPAPIPIPAGLTLRALTPGLAGVGQQIVLQGNATVVGIVLRRFAFGDFGSIAASAGTVTLDGVKAIGSAAAPSGLPAVLALSGTVHATMTPGSVADYADQLTPAGQGVAVYGTLAGTARLTVNGGTFGGAALGGADPVNGAFNRGAFNLTGSSRLDLNNVVLGVDSSGVFLYGAATQLHLSASVVHANAGTGSGYGIHAAKGTPQITLVNSSISGFADAVNRSSVGIQVGTFAQPGVAATVSATNSVVASNNIGVFVSELGSSPSSLTLNGTNVGIAANTHGGIVCRDACSVDISGGEISENATSDPAAASPVFHGGVWMGVATKTYQLRLRNTIVVDNTSTAGGNASASDNSGVTMAGNASSGFDLGTGASPGNNLIAAHSSSPQTSGLNVGVAPGVTVRAVGNTFMPNVQGANAQGRYQLGTAPCGASSCTLTSGAGINFRITTGALRLAE